MEEQVEENKRIRPENELTVKKTGTFIHPIDICSMAKHPTQPHVIVGGGANGVLAFWDLRGKFVVC